MSMKERCAEEAHVRSGAGGGTAAPGTGHKEQEEQERDSGRLEASEPRGSNPHHGQGSRSTVNGHLSCSAYQRGISSAFSRLLHAS